MQMYYNVFDNRKGKLMRKLLLLILLIFVPIVTSAMSISRTSYLNVNGLLSDFCTRLNNVDTYLFGSCSLINEDDYDGSIENSQSYLYNMSPFYVDGGNIISSDGNNSLTEAGIRPSIYLKSNVVINGRGTVDDPYILSESSYTVTINVNHGYAAQSSISVKRGELVATPISVDTSNGYSIRDYVVDCSDVGAIWSITNGEFRIKNVRANTSCEIYFTKSLAKEIYDQNVNRLLRTNLTSNFSDSNNGNTIYYEDENTLDTCTENNINPPTFISQDICRTYYFAGESTNNYVKFGKEDGNDILWRIIRINEDGSVRLIKSTYITTNASFNSNSSSSSNMYYSNSNAKLVVDAWYNNTLSGYDDKIQVSKFCESIRVVPSASFKDIVGNSVNIQSNYTPRFDCVSDAAGKGILDLKVGLISYDEMHYIGISNNSYNNWTMSPAGYSSNNSYVWNGYSNYSTVSSTSPYLYPVISLKPNVMVKSGSGTSVDPYIIN